MLFFFFFFSFPFSFFFFFSLRFSGDQEGQVGEVEVMRGQPALPSSFLSRISFSFFQHQRADGE